MKRLSKSKIGLSFAIIVSIALALTWLNHGQNAERADRAGRPPLPSSEGKASRPERATTLGRREANPDVLETLKQEWLRLPSYDPAVGLSDQDVIEREHLAMTSVMRLGFSQELIDLARFMRENNLRINRRGASLFGFVNRLLQDDPSQTPRFQDGFLKILADGGGGLSWQFETIGLARMLASHSDSKDAASYVEALEALHPSLAREAEAVIATNALKSGTARLDVVIDGFLDHLTTKGEPTEGLSDSQLMILVQNNMSMAAEDELGRVFEMLRGHRNQDGRLKYRATIDQTVQALARFTPDEVVELLQEDGELRNTVSLRRVGLRAFGAIRTADGFDAAVMWLSTVQDTGLLEEFVRACALNEGARFLRLDSPETRENLTNAHRIIRVLPPERRGEVLKDYPALLPP
jgi:hypothetical protein